jgi:hypothetical protein
LASAAREGKGPLREVDLDAGELSKREHCP